MRSYFYKLLFRYLSFFISSNQFVISIDPINNLIHSKFALKRAAFSKGNDAKLISSDSIEIDQISDFSPDHIMINGSLHYEHDIQELLQRIRFQCSHETRLIITYYSALWKPVLKIATLLGLRSQSNEENWISPEDISNFLLLAEFDEVHTVSRILFPVKIPFISDFINRYIAPLPFFNLFNLLNIVIARPSGCMAFDDQPSVSVVVAARNEEGNIDELIRRLPAMGPDDELIFIEGGSKDKTWQKINEVMRENVAESNIIAAQQDGTGKGDAIRKGFSLATKDILMILDADLTVPPEDLPKFYEAIVSGKGEYINGSRLVYPMEKKAMRFFNILGNKFFALSFSSILGQRFKDTLCGTKVLSRKNYKKLAENRNYFGDFDPFGDFDLIFGSTKLALKTIEVPILYRERLYGDTNISRWKHGLILLRMLIFAARKIKFI